MEAIITSKDNQYIKLARGLQRKKIRLQKGLFLAEGIRNCREAFQAAVSIPYLLIAESQWEFTEINELKDRGVEQGTKIFPVADALFSGFSATETPQGVAAIVRLPQFDEMRFSAATAGAPIVLLDGLQDMGNLGTILRTAWAAALGGVICVNHTADCFSPKTVRSAMGAVYHLPVWAPSNETALNFLRTEDYQLVVADASGMDYRSFQPGDRKIAWLLGNEGNGVSDFWREQADRILSIPMAPRVESLNVAVAAGILFFSQMPSLAKE